MVESAPLPFIVSEPQSGRILFANLAARALYGYSIDDVTKGTAVLRYAQANARTQFLESLSRQGFCRDTQVDIIDAHGGERTVLISASMTQRAGQAVLLESAVDITTRTKQETALRETTSYLESILHNAPVAIYGFDLQGVVNVWNPEAERIYGWSAVHMIGTSVSLLLPDFGAAQPPTAAEQASLQQRIDDLVSGRVARSVGRTFSRRHKSGRLLKLSITSELIRRVDGGVEGVMALARDIEAEQQAQNALLESNLFLNALVESSPVGVFTLDLDFNISSWNQSCENIFGWRADEVLGGPLPFITAEKQAEAQAILGNALAGNVVRGIEIERVRKDASAVNILGSVAVIKDGSQKPLGIVGIVADITLRKEVQNQYETLLKRSLDGFWIRTTDGTIIDVNDAYCRISGYAREELVGKNIKEFLDTASAAPNPHGLSGGIFEDLHRTKSGDLVPMETSLSSTEEGGGRVFAFMRDLRGRRALEDRLCKRERRFRSLLERSSDILTIISEHGTFTYASPALESMLGYPPQALLGRPLRDLIHPDDQENFGTVFAITMERSGRTRRTEFRFRSQRGDWRVLEAMLTNALADPDIRGVISNGRDITQRRQAEEQIRALALYDGLTGLPNRALLKAESKQVLARAQRADAHVGLMFIDLDRFKYVNDSLGHAVGDLLLQELAQRLKSAVRDGDMVARLGGDEFVVLLPDVASPRAHGRVAEKILEVTQAPFNLEGHELFVTPSIGIAVFPDHGKDIDALLKAADAAMYEAKAAGKNTYRFFEAEMTTQASNRLALENDLRRGLKASEFEMFYQPQVNARSQEIIGLEALIRWRHPTRGLLLPGVFIAVAEETGLINALGAWVIDAVLDDMQRWRRAQVRIPPVAINVSGTQFLQPNFYETLCARVKACGIDPGLIELEMTESAYIRRESEALQTMTALAADGFGISIDDFGTGYSSLEYLKRMPFTRLKIDRTFVIDLATSADAVAIVQAIVALARTLELGVVAEGVETAEQRDVLMQCGCHVMQGFFYSAPVNAIAVSGIVARFRALPDHLRLARTSRLSTLDITDSPPGLRPAH